MPPAAKSCPPVLPFDDGQSQQMAAIHVNALKIKSWHLRSYTIVRVGCGRRNMKVEPIQRRCDPCVPMREDSGKSIMIQNLDLKPSTPAQCKSGASNNRCHRCDDNVWDHQLNVHWEAWNMWYYRP
ncbi:hypothetical protein EVAR_12509_1 [Eumeta japonica]|uniref:Uncharacterized protein n=1 Tax=Eumeta variegata TaxID=151549 RepID=A0A4C1TPL7_EUMVA|nr:hypothetical protein EVAR_12509_1 [Eumeta japonica]